MAARSTKSSSSRATPRASKSCRRWPTCTATSSSICATCRFRRRVVELVPESVARENAVMPLAEEDGALKVLVSDPFDFETFEKLQFILNRKVDIALATRESILEAINRNYGQMGGESADSMLQEFTDTAIDFTETEEGRTAAAAKTSTRPAPRSCGWCS